MFLGTIGDRALPDLRDIILGMYQSDFVCEKLNPLTRIIIFLNIDSSGLWL